MEQIISLHGNHPGRIDKTNPAAMKVGLQHDSQCSDGLDYRVIVQKLSFLHQLMSAERERVCG